MGKTVHTSGQSRESLEDPFIFLFGFLPVNSGTAVQNIFLCVEATLRIKAHQAVVSMSHRTSFNGFVFFFKEKFDTDPNSRHTRNLTEH